MPSVSTSLLQDYDHPALGLGQWAELLSAGGTDTVFLTWHWQRAWWDSFGRGELMIIAAEREGRVVALAPLFSDAGMIFFVGSGGSDYLDFIGDLRSTRVLSAILEAAREFVSDFVGFRFYHVPENSRTGTMLKEVADGLGLSCFDEGILPAPALALAAEPELAHAALRKKSLVRHENYFRRRGTLQVHHFQDGKDILPHLKGFFEQHVARWAVTPYSSLFKDQIQRDFYEKLTRVAARTGWLRFTRLDWGGRPIAFHFGFCYRGNYLWYKPSFAVELARRSPGEVLLRQLLAAAIDEGASTLDFGLGDEAFKQRFATHTNSVRTWGLYPS